MAVEITPELESQVTSPTMVAADATGNKVKNPNGAVAFWFALDAGAGGPQTITLIEQRFCSFHHAHVNYTITLQPGDTVKARLCAPERFNDVSGYLVSSYVSHVDITVGAITQEIKRND